jgi:hypothetical protein
MVSDIWQYDNNGHWRVRDISLYDSTSQGILGNILHDDNISQRMACDLEQ